MRSGHIRHALCPLRLAPHAMKTWKKIKEIFSEALELDKSERVTYIKKACKDEPELMDEVLSLIEAHEISGVLDRPIDDIRMSAISVAKEDRMKGMLFGNYRIVKELGHGGMGSVYLAERADGEYDQLAALKLLHSPFASDHQVKRFKNERQILASLEHDHIARLLDGGITDNGQPYYVMENVDGQPIDVYCNQHQLSIKERLNLFVDVCGAVQYAHRKLIVHRDLKPSNILVTKDGRIKLLDFGIAKVLSNSELSGASAVLTRRGLLPVTPAYASPEQVRGEEVSTASDVYQLGLVLYELLTGILPYNVSDKTPGEIERIICDEYPVRPSIKVSESPKNHQKSEHKPTGLRPSKVKKRLRGDLDTVILKALRKEPERRYESAEQLGADIKHYLSSRPVTAHPDSRIYRTRKYISRHRWGVTTTIAIFLSLIMGIGVAIWQAQKAQTALAKTEEALNRAETLQGFLTDLFLPGALDRPADQLPNTEELLESGARQALESETILPAERLGILVTISEIYISRGWPGKASPLLDEAIKLGNQHKEDWPDDLARALYFQARIESWNGNPQKSSELYKDAEKLVQGENQFWDLYAMIRTGRGYFEYYQGNYSRVLNLIEPLYEQIINMDTADQQLQTRVRNLLANTYGYIGELDKAMEFQNTVIQNYRELDGSDSRRYAIALTNSINLNYNMGHFDRAKENAREAISIYNRIYDEPTSVLSVTYGALSIALLFEGQFEEALSAVETAGQNFSIVRNKDNNEWEVPEIYKGMLLANMQRWSEAKNYLMNNREYFDDIHHSMLFTSLDGLLAETLCRTGKIGAGMNLLTNSDNSNGVPEMDNPVYIAKEYEALARCHFETGEQEEALREINKSIDAMNYPGRAIEIARRYQLKAEIFTELGQKRRAVTVLQNAEIQFQNLGLETHPVLLSTRIKHGLSLARINQFEKAEELLLDNLNTLREFNTFTYSLIKEKAIRGIVDLYMMWGRDDQAEVFTAQLAQMQSDR